MSRATNHRIREGSEGGIPTTNEPGRGGRRPYLWDSEDYARNSSAQLAWAHDLIDKLLLQETESVLDIGCGNGEVTARIASRVPLGSVTGIDSAQSMVCSARRRFPPSAHPNLSFVHMDASAITFRNRFDAAFSNAALHWIRDQRSVLKGVRASLKPSGRILFQMGGRGNARDIVDTVDMVRKRARWRPYFRRFSFPYCFCEPDEYTGWLADAGMKTIRAELIPKDMPQTGSGGLAGWIRTTWLPYTERIPEERREEFVDEVVSLYTQRFPPDGDGMVHVKMVRLEVEAVCGGRRG